MKSTNNRILATSIFLLFMFSLIVVRLLFLQVWNYQKLQNLVNAQVVQTKVQNSIRGTIYDRNQHVLAMNVKSYSISANSNLIEDKKEFSDKLSKCSGLNSAEIYKQISRKSGFSWIKRQYQSDKYDDLENLKMKGLNIQKTVNRYYPCKDLTAQLVGVVGIDGQGLSGIELYYDSLVKREKVVEVFNRDGMRNALRMSSLNGLKSPDIVLFIDSTLQYIAGRELESAMKKTRAESGFIIMQNPKNGEILAVASYPNFNPNTDKIKTENLVNPAIHKVFEPGSTFKIVTAAAALTERKYKPDDIIYCENGSFKYQDIEVNDHEKYGYLSMDGLMAYSSNIGFAKVGMALGREKIYYWMKQFGFGNYTGSNFPGEQMGIVFNPFSSKWSSVSGLTISFGQGICVTGLQMINAYSAIANGGKLYEPQIVKSVIDDNDNMVFDSEPRLIREVISTDVSEKLKKMLNDVVEIGTGQLANVEGYSVCGKTGTAQKIDPKTKHYSTSKYIASFCGFLPMEDPQITILVVLDEPKTSYWASDVACPVFSRIAKESMNYLNIPKKEKKYDITKLSY
ncbi:MAG: hypothetical protein A2252_10470 [Elusimicrobia bacterium RIFOXYA2_FULL_39_19]|nr:MAG: hypothetical protein A2252_10470 [Elusimicrobia bacterium RIFOXYA2_FULL_39_19]